MPYGSYAGPEIGVTNAVRMMKESGAEVLKLHPGREGASIIRAVADAGVAVMRHVGLLPHKVHQMGGFKMHGRTAEAALEIIADARAGRFPDTEHSYQTKPEEIARFETPLKSEDATGKTQAVDHCHAEQKCDAVAAIQVERILSELFENHHHHRNRFRLISETGFG